MKNDALARVYCNVYRGYVRFRKLHNKSKKTSLPLYKKEIERKIDEDLAFALSDLEKILGEKVAEELIELMSTVVDREEWYKKEKK